MCGRAGRGMTGDAHCVTGWRTLSTTCHDCTLVLYRLYCTCVHQPQVRLLLACLVLGFPLISARTESQQAKVILNT